MTSVLERAPVGRVRRDEGRPPRAKRRCRPITVLDLMIVVAATAVGFALDRSLPVLEHLGIPRTWAVELPCLMAWTIAAFVIRLRRPRPVFRWLMRQPGAVATHVVMLLVPIAGAIGVVAWVAKGILNHYRVPTGNFLPLPLILIGAAAMAGAFVAGGWLSLALSGRRRTEAGWIDLLGRVVGTLWIVHFGAFAVILWMLSLPR